MVTDWFDKLKLASCRWCEQLAGPLHRPRAVWKSKECRCQGGIGADEDIDQQHLCKWFKDTRKR